MISIFFDSDALVAMNWDKDTSRMKAFRILKIISSMPHVLYTSLNVLIETLTIISQRMGKAYANSLLKELRSGKYIVIHPDDNLISESEEIFRSIKSKNVSYSDCISFTVMRRYGIEWVFSFDSHFRKQGFKRVGIDGKIK